MPSYDDFDFQKSRCYGLVSKLPKNDMQFVVRALKSAEKWHHWQTRIYKKKTPFMIHIYGVLNILMKEFKVRDPDFLASAALHDTLEDCGIGYGKLKGMFGAKVANMVRADSQNFFPNREVYMKHFMKESKDVKLLKLVDRLDNIKTGYFKLRWTNEKLVQYIIETEKYMLPMAKSMGRPAYSRLKRLIDGLKKKDELKSLYKRMKTESRIAYEDTEPHRPG